MYKDETSDSLSSLKAAADPQLVRMADILFAERMKIKIGEWRAGLLHNTNKESELQGSSIDINQNLQTTFFKLRPALVLNALTSRQLRLTELVIYFLSFYFHCTLVSFLYGPLLNFGSVILISQKKNIYIF